MKFSKLLLLWLAVPMSCAAGGTLSTSELTQLIRQMPEVWEMSRSNLILSDSAYAQTRLGPRFVKLSAARIGPYIISAKSRITGRPLYLVLCTRVRFLDRRGRELGESDIEQAVKIEETLTGATLTKTHDLNKPVSCAMA